MVFMTIFVEDENDSNVETAPMTRSYKVTNVELAPKVPGSSKAVRRSEGDRFRVEKAAKANSLHVSNASTPLRTSDFLSA